jgi:hypothetical protein
VETTKLFLNSALTQHCKQRNMLHVTLVRSGNMHTFLTLTTQENNPKQNYMYTFFHYSSIQSIFLHVYFLSLPLNPINIFTCILSFITAQSNQYFYMHTFFHCRSIQSIFLHVYFFIAAQSNQYFYMYTFITAQSNPYFNLFAFVI